MSKTENTLTQPLFAAIGVGDLAYKSVADAITTLRTRAEEASDDAQARLGKLEDEVPSSIEDLRARFSPEELRKVAEAYISVATQIYTSLAERGEETVDRLKAQPAVADQISRAEKVYNDVVDRTEGALGSVSQQTRAVGERAAKLATFAASKSDEVTGEILDAGSAAEDAATGAASKIDDIAGKVEEGAHKSEADAAEATDV